MPTAPHAPSPATASALRSAALYRDKMVQDLGFAFVLERPLTTISEPSIWLWLTSERGMTGDEADGLAADVTAVAKREAR